MAFSGANFGVGGVAFGRINGTKMKEEVKMNTWGVIKIILYVLYVVAIFIIVSVEAGLAIPLFFSLLISLPQEGFLGRLLGWLVPAGIFCLGVFLSERLGDDWLEGEPWHWVLTMPIVMMVVLPAILAFITMFRIIYNLIYR